MKRSTLLLLLLTLTVISSCSKDEVKNTTTQSFNIDLLFTAKWKLAAMTIDPGVDRNGTLTTDLYPELSSWNTDNTRLYIANGSGIDDEGPTKFGANDPQTLPIAWSINTEKTKLTITRFQISNTYTDTYDILQLDASTLKLSLKMDGSKIGGTHGKTYALITTYVH